METAPKNKTATLLSEIRRSASTYRKNQSRLNSEFPVGSREELRQKLFDYYCSESGIADSRIMDVNAQPESYATVTEIEPASCQKLSEVNFLTTKVPRRFEREFEAKRMYSGGVKNEFRRIPEILRIESFPGTYYFSCFRGVNSVFRKNNHGTLELLRDLSSNICDYFFLIGGHHVWEEPEVDVDILALVHDSFGPWNYCHWLLDYVPKLLPILNGGIPTDRLTIAIPRRIHAFQRESLKKIGIQEKNIIELHDLNDFRASTIRARQVIGSSLINRGWRHALRGGSPDAANFLRQLFLPANFSRQSRIVIDRRLSRRLIISERAKTALKSAGFEWVFFEDLDFDGQVSIMTSASAVLGCHGAGLSNMVFAERGSSLLEVFPPDLGLSPNLGSLAYHRVCSAIGAKYFAAVAEVHGPPASREIDSDLFCPDSAIFQWLEEI